jgi:hypothetical protein
MNTSAFDKEAGQHLQGFTDPSNCYAMKRHDIILGFFKDKEISTKNAEIIVTNSLQTLERHGLIERFSASFNKISDFPRTKMKPKTKFVLLTHKGIALRNQLLEKSAAITEARS